MALTAPAADAAAGPIDYRQQRFIARGIDTTRPRIPLRSDPSSLRQPYPSRFYSEESRGIKGCRWLMQRAIETKNTNWLQRYRGCAQ